MKNLSVKLIDGLKYPRGLTIGAKYEATRDALKQKMNEANIDNFAVLDAFLS